MTSTTAACADIVERSINVLVINWFPISQYGKTQRFPIPGPRVVSSLRTFGSLKLNNGLFLTLEALESSYLKLGEVCAAFFFIPPSQFPNNNILTFN